MSPNPIPLFHITSLVHRVRRQLRDLLVLNLLRQDEVQDEGDEGGDGEAGLEDELDGVVEAGEGVVVAAVGEDVAEPSATLLAMHSTNTALTSKKGSV